MLITLWNWDSLLLLKNTFFICYDSIARQSWLIWNVVSEFVCSHIQNVCVIGILVRNWVARKVFSKLEGQRCNYQFPSITWKVNDDFCSLLNRLENKILVMGFLLLTILGKEWQEERSSGQKSPVWKEKLKGRDTVVKVRTWDFQEKIALISNSKRWN